MALQPTFEHGILSVTNGDITREEAKHLLGLSVDLCRVHTFDSIKMQKLSGIVITDPNRRLLEILPKFEAGDAQVQTQRNLLLKLLKWSGRIPSLEGRNVQMQGAPCPTLLEVFINQFLLATEQVVVVGLVKLYRRQTEEHSRVIRGKINIKRQVLANQMRPDCITCSYDVLDDNNVWNQSIKLALYECSRWISNPEILRSWSRLTSAFNHVASGNHGSVIRFVSDPPYTRQTYSYEPCMQWCRLILNLLQPTMRIGPNITSRELLWDTPDLFEAAVANQVALHVSDKATVHTKYRNPRSITLDQDGRLVRYLDFYIKFQDDGRDLIMDAKWKEWEGTPKRDDVHQMVSYATAMQCQDVALVYPFTQAVGDIVYTIRGIKLNILFVSMDEDGMYLRRLPEDQQDPCNRILPSRR